MHCTSTSYLVEELIASRYLAVGDGYRAKNEELSKLGLPFARAGNINNGFDFKDVDHLDKANISKAGHKISQSGDVVFTSKGTVGRFALVRQNTPQFVYSPQLCYWRSLEPNVIDSSYLYYWMHSREFYNQYKGVAGQTDMADYVSLTDQRRMHLTLPDIGEQRTIASILGSLDDKIELNRRMNQTLEAMAHALFKFWFVDFDPVRAKQEGRAPGGMDTEIAALFPSDFEESELGLIPNGWSCIKLKRTIELHYGKALQAQSRRPGDYPVYGSNGQVGWHDQYLVEGPGLIIGRKGVPGSVTWSDYNFFPIDTTFYVQLLPALTSMRYAYYVLKTLDLPSLAADSAVPGLNRDAALSSSFALPDIKIQSAYDTIVAPMLRKIKQLDAENQTLSTLRDTLLPKLISGELRVADARRELEAVHA